MGNKLLGEEVLEGGRGEEREGNDEVEVEDGGRGEEGDFKDRKEEFKFLGNFLFFLFFGIEIFKELKEEEFEKTSGNCFSSIYLFFVSFSVCGKDVWIQKFQRKKKVAGTWKEKERKVLFFLWRESLFCKKQSKQKQSKNQRKTINEISN